MSDTEVVPEVTKEERDEFIDSIYGRYRAFFRLDGTEWDDQISIQEVERDNNDKLVVTSI